MRKMFKRKERQCVMYATTRPNYHRGQAGRLSYLGYSNSAIDRVEYLLR